MLVHGLWMGSACFWPLARRLRRAGAATQAFDWSSTRRPFEAESERLARLLDQLPETGTPLRLVGHSLGGLLVLAALERLRAERDARVVLLATPLQGSRAVLALAAHPLGRALLGHAGQPLGKRVDWPSKGDVRALQIAGSLGWGMGRWVSALKQPHDGAVEVAETRHANLSEHWVLRSSHSGLLLSRQAASLTSAWLGELTVLP